MNCEREPALSQPGLRGKARIAAFVVLFLLAASCSGGDARGGVQATPSSVATSRAGSSSVPAQESLTTPEVTAVAVARTEMPITPRPGNDGCYYLLESGELVPTCGGIWHRAFNETLGVRISLPSLWNRTDFVTSGLADVSGPLPIMAISTVPIDPGRHQTCAGLPSDILRSMSGTDLALMIMEVPGPGALPAERPAVLDLEDAVEVDLAACGSDTLAGYVFRFTDKGRSIEILLATGSEVDQDDLEDALVVVNSLWLAQG